MKLAYDAPVLEALDLRATHDIDGEIDLDIDPVAEVDVDLEIDLGLGS